MHRGDLWVNSHSRHLLQLDLCMNLPCTPSPRLAVHYPSLLISTSYWGWGIIQWVVNGNKCSTFTLCGMTIMIMIAGKILVNNKVNKFTSYTKILLFLPENSTNKMDIIRYYLLPNSAALKLWPRLKLH